MSGLARLIFTVLLLAERSVGWVLTERSPFLPVDQQGVRGTVHVYGSTTLYLTAEKGTGHDLDSVLQAWIALGAAFQLGEEKERKRRDQEASQYCT